MALNEKQKRFCHEYIIDLNATQAAIRSGYSEKTAYSIGHENLTKPEIQKFIQAIADKRAARTEITQDRVLAAIAAVAFGDTRKLFDADGNLKLITELDDDAAQMIAGLDVVVKNLGDGEVEHIAKIKQNDRLRALDMLGRHLSIYNDKHTIEHAGSVEHNASDKLKEYLGGIAERSGTTGKSKPE